MNFDAPMKDESTSGLDDNVLLEVAPAKPRKPPPNIGKKPPSKKKADDEEEKLDAPADGPKKGPPARLAGGNKPAAAAGPTRTIKAADIVEEDLGPGMSKETAIDKVNDFYAAEHVAKFEEAKWQDKQHGFTGF